MNFALSHIDLYPPSELLPYWFVSDDFAGLLGLDYSSDAAKVLTAVIPPRYARIDYEADAVTVRISRNDRVIPTLSAIYARIGWDTAELASLESQVIAFKRPRPRKISIGDVFVVPIGSELFGLGQVLQLIYKSPTVAIFACVASASEVEGLANATANAKALTILHIGGNSLYNGQWRVIGSAPVRDSPSSGPGGHRNRVGSTSYGGDGPIVLLLRAYAGLQPWEEGYRDPNFLRKLVIPQGRGWRLRRYVGRLGRDIAVAIGSLRDWPSSGS